MMTHLILNAVQIYHSMLIHESFSVNAKILSLLDFATYNHVNHGECIVFKTT